MPQGGQSPLFWQPKQERPWLKIAAAGGGLLVVIVVIVAIVVSGDETAPAKEPRTDVAPSASSGQPPAPPSSPADQPAKLPPPPASTAAPAPPPKQDVDACVAHLFGEGTFEGELPSFAFICKLKDPRKAAPELSSRLIYAERGKGGATDAMREWSILNWYEMAVVSLARAACCPDPAPLDTGGGRMCKFDPALNALGQAGVQGAGFDEALAAYDKSVQCLINFGATDYFKQHVPIHGPEREAFKRIVGRVKR